MKKQIAGFLIVACLGTFSWAQGTKADLFDTVKSAQELEIMKGILGTTLSFVTQNLQRQAASTGTPRPVNTPFGTYAVAGSWRTANINAFYLYGQGAVFIMPTSSFRGAAFGSNFKIDTDSTEYLRLADEVTVQAADAAYLRAMAGHVVAPQAAKAPVAPKTPPAAVQLKDEELRKKVAEAQEKVKKSREEIEANRAKLMANLDQIKGYLIEAIANHGDSLTTVKPNEYITLVLMTDDLESSLFRGEGGQRNPQQVISVQKSQISEYKAGRLTLDALKQKVLQYSE